MLSILTLHLLAATALAQVIIEEPTFRQCETATITWSGGTPPYNVYIYPEAYLDYSSFLEQIGPVDGTSAQYLVNLPEGDRLRVNVRDSSTSIEDSAFVGPKQIGAGNSDSCLAEGPLGTGGLPDVPSGTGLPSISSFSFSGTDFRAPLSSTTTSSASISTTTSASNTIAPTSTSSSTSVAQLPTGPRNGDGPAESSAPNGALGSSRSSTFMTVVGLLTVIGNTVM